MIMGLCPSCMHATVGSAVCGLHAFRILLLKLVLLGDAALLLQPSTLLLLAPTAWLFSLLQSCKLAGGSAVQCPDKPQW